MTYDELSCLATQILDGYYTLCDGAEAIQYAIEDYLSRTPESGMCPWSPDGETPVTPQEFLSAIHELISYFQLQEGRATSSQQTVGFSGRTLSFPFGAIRHLRGVIKG